MTSSPTSLPRILVLTPMKNTAAFIENYFSGLLRLDFPRELISIGIIEGDSTDGTLERLKESLSRLDGQFRRVGLYNRNYGFAIPTGVPRWAPAFQYPRRAILAKSRNYLLSKALDDEDWVLWLDADVIDYPSDVIQRLLSYRRDIIQPDCVTRARGPSFDTNAWAKKGTLHIDGFRGMPCPQRLDAVGATMLLVRVDLHREGLIFPPFPFGDRHPAIRNENPVLPFGRGKRYADPLCGEA